MSSVAQKNIFLVMNNLLNKPNKQQNLKKRVLFYVFAITTNKIRFTKVASLNRKSNNFKD